MPLIAGTATQQSPLRRMRSGYGSNCRARCPHNKTKRAATRAPTGVPLCTHQSFLFDNSGRSATLLFSALNRVCSIRKRITEELSTCDGAATAPSKARATAVFWPNVEMHLRQPKVCGLLNDDPDTPADIDANATEHVTPSIPYQTRNIVISTHTHS